MKLFRLSFLALIIAGCETADPTGGGPAISAPLPPTNVTATATAPTNVNLAWTDNANNEDGFRIERKLLSSSYVQIASLPANTTSYADPNVNSGTTYTYKMYSFNSAGSSNYTLEVSVTTP